MKTKNWQIPKNKLALKIKNLTKTYQGESEYYALDDVSLNVKAGSIFGLLGPNGAGKSTLINIISGIVFKSSGDVSVWGMDIEKERKQSKLAVGIVPQELNIDAFFTPDELGARRFRGTGTEGGGGRTDEHGANRAASE